MEANKPTLREIVDEYSSIVRFSKSLGISRPSTYKYIDLFDRGTKEGIPEDIIKVFNTIVMTPKTGWRNLFNKLYDNYLNQEEVREMQDPVPKDIAETIDRLGMTVDQIDERIENALRVRENINNLGYAPNHPRILQVEQDLKSLQYTRDMIERRNKEIRFWPVTEGELIWAVDECNYGFQYPYTDATLNDKPELKDSFKYSIMKNSGGYTFLFHCPDCLDNHITVTISVSLPGQVSSVLGEFTNKGDENYIVIPKIFDYSYAYHFRYKVVRKDGNGKVLNNMMELPLAYRGR